MVAGVAAVGLFTAAMGGGPNLTEEAVMEAVERPVECLPSPRDPPGILRDGICRSGSDPDPAQQ